jgi:hypothetical protein
MPTEAEIRQVVTRVVAGLTTETTSPTAPTQQPTSTDKPSIAIGCDHGGYPLKERLGFRLREQGYEVTDCGTDSADSVDYPDFAHAVAQHVSSGRSTYGIIIDGARIGSSITANKVPKMMSTTTASSILNKFSVYFFLHPLTLHHKNRLQIFMKNIL